MVMLVLIMVMVVMLMLVIIMIMVVVMMMRLLLQQSLQLVIERVFLCHGGDQLCAGQLVPFGRDDRRGGVQLPQTLYGIMQLRFGLAGRVAQDQAACVGDLVVEELAEVLLIHLAFFRIDDRGEAVQLNVLHVQILHCADDVAQLADARRLNEDAVRVVFFEHLLKCLAEVSDEAAADTAGVHLVDPDACFLEETAVNADLPEFVFDQHELFALIAVLDELLDERGLAGSEKARKNGDFGHDIALLSMKL